MTSLDANSKPYHPTQPIAAEYDREQTHQDRYLPDRCWPSLAWPVEYQHFPTVQWYMAGYSTFAALFYLQILADMPPMCQ